MNMFSKVAIATLSMVGVAAAQPAAKDKPAMPAPAKPMPVTSGKVVEAKPAAQPELPKPPAELDAMAKTMAGTWRCKGDMFDPTGNKEAVTATTKTKLDLDKWWLVENLEVKSKMGTMKMVFYTTYDATSKKWRRVGVDNWGGQMVGTSDGMKENKMTWNLDTMGPMGAGLFRDHVDASDPKTGIKSKGEMSTDKGKTWMTAYEMTCKK